MRMSLNIGVVDSDLIRTENYFLQTQPLISCADKTMSFLVLREKNVNISNIFDSMCPYQNEISSGSRPSN